MDVVERTGSGCWTCYNYYTCIGRLLTWTHPFPVLHLGCQLTMNSITAQWERNDYCPPLNPEIRPKWFDVSIHSRADNTKLNSLLQPEGCVAGQMSLKAGATAYNLSLLDKLMLIQKKKHLLAYRSTENKPVCCCMCLSCSCGYVWCLSRWWCFHTPTVMNNNVVPLHHCSHAQNLGIWIWCVFVVHSGLNHTTNGNLFCSIQVCFNFYFQELILFCCRKSCLWQIKINSNNTIKFDVGLS